MKNKFIWLGLNFLLVATMLLASCSTSSTSTTTTTKTTATTITTTTTLANTTVTTTAPTTTTATGNWWDSLGAPQYGGTITIRDTANVTCWDPYSSPGTNNVMDLYGDHLSEDIWTLDPATYSYQMDFRPYTFVTGDLAETWEYTTHGTLVVHLRKGIHWQNLPPANGRDFVASDVVASYQRLFGAGGGPASPFFAQVAQWKQLQSVTADGNYTVIFQWSTPSVEFINEMLFTASIVNVIQCPDGVTLYGNLNDWHHAVGTGAFMVTDFVSSSSVTLDKNPNYWASDERHPQNRLPYAQHVQVLIIPDDSTALSAMRTGKIDIMYGMNYARAQTMQKSNPEILQIPVLGLTCLDLDMRQDKTPFNDINVRQALQMSIDLQDLAKNYYHGTTSPDPSTLANNQLAGWGFPYSEWPQDLKDQYAYNVAGAKALLTAAGYTNGFDTNVLARNDWDLDLLQIVKDDFATINVNMTIKSVDPATWTSIARTAHNVDAMSFGYTDLGNSFEPTPMLGNFLTGQSSNIGHVSDPDYDALYAKVVGSSTTDEFKTYFSNAARLVAEQHFVISLLPPTTYAFCQPWLKGYNGQRFAADFSQNSPLWGGFYLARFWVDSVVKTK